MTYELYVYIILTYNSYYENYSGSIIKIWNKFERIPQTVTAGLHITNKYTIHRFTTYIGF